MEYILIFITAIFVNNVVLSQFLGICPFLGVSKKVETATGMGAGDTFFKTISTICTNAAMIRIKAIVCKYCKPKASSTNFCTK